MSETRSIIYIAAPVAPREGEIAVLCQNYRAHPTSTVLFTAIDSADLICPACRSTDFIFITSQKPDPHDLIEFNLQNAKAWASWLMASRPDCAIIAPWILFCETLDDTKPEDRARGQRDDDFILTFGGVDEVCCVAGRLSSGMKRDAQVGRAAGTATRDLTQLGQLPPTQPMPELFTTASNRLICNDSSCFEHWLKTGKHLESDCDVCGGKGWYIGE